MSKYTIIIATAVLTFLYVGLVIWLHYGSAADASIGQYVANNNLNSVGDFLAGLFSPLAFLWLIATVLIQSNELSLQRDELAENRAVMGKQAEAAEKQAQFLGRQIDAMERQNNLANQVAIADHKFRLFDKRLAVYEMMMNVGQTVFTEGEVSSETHSKIARVQQTSKWFFDDNVAEWLQEIYGISRDALLGERKIKRELQVREDRPNRWSDEREAALDALRVKINGLIEKLEAMLEPVEIKKNLGDFLKIPAKIEPYEKAIHDVEQHVSNAKPK